MNFYHLIIYSNLLNKLSYIDFDNGFNIDNTYTFTLWIGAIKLQLHNNFYSVRCSQNDSTSTLCVCLWSGMNWLPLVLSLSPSLAFSHRRRIALKVEVLHFVCILVFNSIHFDLVFWGAQSFVWFIWTTSCLTHIFVSLHQWIYCHLLTHYEWGSLFFAKPKIFTFNLFSLSLSLKHTHLLPSVKLNECKPKRFSNCLVWACL